MNTKKKKCREYHKYLLCPKTVKRYVSGHTVLSDYTMQREAEVSCWQLVIVSKRRCRISHLFFFFLHATSWCSCHTGASEVLVHCRGNIKHPDRNTKKKEQCDHLSYIITSSALMNYQHLWENMYLHMHPFWNGGDGVLIIPKLDQ